MTKAEEREVLEQVRNLIAGTDYIRQAFTGILEMAEQNIDCDMWDSMPDRLESRDREIQKLKAEIIRQNKESGAKIVELEHERDVLRKQVEDLNHDYSIEEKHNAELIKALKDMNVEYGKAQDALAEWQERAGNMKLEIIELKAEIYDLRKELGK